MLFNKGLALPSSILVNLNAFLPSLMAARALSTTGATLELRTEAPSSASLKSSLSFPGQISQSFTWAIFGTEVKLSIPQEDLSFAQHLPADYL